MIEANPTSKPYVPFRTSPFEHPHLHHSLEWTKEEITKTDIASFDYSSTNENTQCPLRFSLGMSQRLNQKAATTELGLLAPPVIYPILPSKGPGRQVLFTTHYEHLDMLTPVTTKSSSTSSIIKEGLMQQEEFPMMFESSFFKTSPILHDVNGDGVMDAILTDYDGGIYILGLQSREGTRYFHRAQVPRLFIRRQWMESRLNETLPLDQQQQQQQPETNESAPQEEGILRNRRSKPHDPYHSYFEYTYGMAHGSDKVLRGVTANLLGQDQEDTKALGERRSKKIIPIPKKPS